MFHYRILQQLNNESAAEPDLLTTLLSNLEKKEEEFEQKDPQLFGDKLFLEWCVCNVSKHLATLIAGDEAILLPELYYYFCQKINQNMHKFQNVNIP